MCFYFKQFIKEEKAQAGAEILILIGGMIIIVLIAMYLYKDYLSGIGDEINSSELNKLDSSIKSLSSNFNWYFNIFNNLKV